MNAHSYLTCYYPYRRLSWATEIEPTPGVRNRMGRCRLWTLLAFGMTLAETAGPLELALLRRFGQPHGHWDGMRHRPAKGTRLSRSSAQQAGRMLIRDPSVPLMAWALSHCTPMVRILACHPISF